MIHWYENQEKTTSMGLQFHRPKLSGESCFTHFLNYGGLCKERSTKQTKDTFQHRALPKKIRETLKISIFSFTITNFVNRGRRGKGWKLKNWKKVLWFWEKSVLILIIYRSNFSFKMQFLSFSWRKNPKFFPKLCFWWLSKCPN